MKRHLLFLFAGTLLISSCSRKILIQSTSKNPPGNETIVDKSSKIVLSVANDREGILINIKIPNGYDQYKVLKYGASLFVNMQNQEKPQYQIAYPLLNNDRSLRLPIVNKKDTSFHIEALLTNLSQEATQMDLAKFYGRNERGVQSNRRDSVAVQVFNEDNSGALTYSAFIPYSSILEFRHSRPTSIKVGFVSGNLEVPREYTNAPGYGPSYYTPRHRRGRNRPTPDMDVVKKLAQPIQFWAQIDLAHR